MCDKCDHKSWLERIEELMINNDNPFLQNVYEWVEENKHITENQQKKVIEMENE